MSAKRYIGRCIGISSAVLGACVAALGWGIARKLTAPVGPRTFNLVIRDIEDRGDRLRIVLDRTRDTEAVGIYNLWFENGGWVQLDDDVQDHGTDQVSRTITGCSAGLTPRAGDRVSWSGIYFATPTDAGLEDRDVKISTAGGYAPSWKVDGDPSTWAIHIHGLGSTRAGTLRGVQVATELGYTSLVVSYRNDGEGPRVGTGRSTLGVTEVDDVEAAIGYAVRCGAERIVLFGWSMGAAIALQIAHRPPHGPLVAGLVLDSPVLNWSAAIETNCRRAGLPRNAGVLTTPWLTKRLLARALGLSSAVQLNEMNWIEHASKLSVPMLILHGSRDDSVPLRVSELLRDRRPDVVTLEVFDAGHTLSWNSHSERWRRSVAEWLFVVQAGCRTPGSLRLNG
ncbi:alpha/beta fold hydrolase [Microbacterium sp. CBA3102]|uniref:alpha/beta hydrolase family protein n=1 Tax=Microbacterium sp. CBA3102 TaxID=2603598 RepID=UPI0011BBD03A|nr:alpha/beta fold hydrolase [Microbacterium sp. CBA3102]QEA29486.1 alpha/beta fold hydrolase [Microbacterium sp. CBA3102]